jgi:hypothetical protein
MLCTTKYYEVVFKLDEYGAGRIYNTSSDSPKLLSNRFIKHSMSSITHSSQSSLQSHLDKILCHDVSDFYALTCLYTQQEVANSSDMSVIFTVLMVLYPDDSTMMCTDYRICSCNNETSHETE